MSDKMRMSCPECLRVFSYPASRAGTAVKCPACHKPIKLEGVPPIVASPISEVNEKDNLSGFHLRWKLFALAIGLVVLTVVAWLVFMPGSTEIAREPTKEEIDSSPNSTSDAEPPNDSVADTNHSSHVDRMKTVILRMIGQGFTYKNGERIYFSEPAAILQGTKDVYHEDGREARLGSLSLDVQVGFIENSACD